MTMTVMIGAGLVLLIVFLAVGHWISDGWSVTRIRAAGWFLPVWFAIAVLNMIVAVTQASVSAGDAVTTLLVAFAVPAAASALVMWWTCRQ